jgi:hypothetical protein
MSNSSQKAIKKAIKLICMMFVLLAIVTWWLWDYDFQGTSLKEIWKQTDGRLFGLSLLLISCAMPCVALRWRALFPKSAKSSANPIYLTGILCAAFVFNFALPGPVGEALSAWMAKEKSKVNFSEAIAGLGLSRIIGLGSACGIAGLVYWIAPFSIPPEWGPALKVTTILLVIASLMLAGIAIFPRIPKAIFVHVGEYSIFQGKRMQQLLRGADQLFNALIETAGRGKAAYIESFFWAVSGHALVASGIYLAILSMGLSADWSAVMFTYTASIAGSVAMFMFPGSSVGWDALFATTLSVTAALPVTVAVAVTGIIRIQQMLVALIGVLVVWVYARDLLMKIPLQSFKSKNKDNSNP